MCVSCSWQYYLVLVLEMLEQVKFNEVKETLTIIHENVLDEEHITDEQKDLINEAMTAYG